MYVIFWAHFWAYFWMYFWAFVARSPNFGVDATSGVQVTGVTKA